VKIVKDLETKMLKNLKLEKKYQHYYHHKQCENLIPVYVKAQDCHSVIGAELPTMRLATFFSFGCKT